jgi:hypothetical protein
MCQKRQRRCPALLAIREEAFEEWTKAETLHDVRAAWGRLGGRVTLHRYGRRHFCELSRRRGEGRTCRVLLEED